MRYFYLFLGVAFVIIITFSDSSQQITAKDNSPSIQAQIGITQFQLAGAGQDLEAKKNMSSVQASGVTRSWWSGVTQNLKKLEYEVSQSDEGLQAPNRANDLRIHFNKQGIEIIRRVASQDPNPWRFKWQTAAWGREGRLTAAGPAILHSEGNRVEYAYSQGLTEWYENQPEGLEQGFRIDKSPEGEGAVIIEGHCPSGLRAFLTESGQAVEFLDSNEEVVLAYKDLYVMDARGRDVPSWLNVGIETVGIYVDDRFAIYPLNIDPWFWDPRVPSANPSWHADGEQSNSHFGFCVASAGDINNDGYSDVVVGAPDYDYLGEDRGKAFLYLGSENGLSTDPDWSFTGDPGDQGGHLYGYSCASGNFNGDQFSDVIIGAPAFLSQYSVGHVELFYGSTAGLVHSNFDNLPVGEDLFTWFGASVSSAGDINNDGFDDILIGETGYENEQGHFGRVFVLTGGPAGSIPVETYIYEFDEVGNAGFGVSVSSAGDINNDGYDDFLVGAPSYDFSEIDQAGRVFYWMGSESGPSATPSWITLLPSEVHWHGRFGTCVSSAGDVNNDGFSDVLIGAPGMDSDGGRAYLYHGNSAGTLGSWGWYAAGSPDAFFGTSVASAGNLNNDSYGDVIIGAPGAGVGGAAYIYMGSAGGLPEPGSCPYWDAEWSVKCDQAYAYFGGSVALAGDVNGDGFDDVIVGAPDYTDDQQNEGRAYLYTGRGWHYEVALRVMTFESYLDFYYKSSSPQGPFWNDRTDSLWVYGGPASGTEGRFEDSEGDPDPQGWTSVDLSCGGCGDFAQVWPLLDEIGYCPDAPSQQNTTPRWAFIDDGEVVPGTDGYLCMTWCYGPNGYIVNPEGGVAGPDYSIYNEIWSPAIAWPVGYGGGILKFEVYAHEPFSAESPGMFCLWRIRSTDSSNPEDISGEIWRERNILYYGGPGNCIVECEVSDLLVPDARYVQVSLGVMELGNVWGYWGTDGTPAPFFDNVNLMAYLPVGPAIYAQEAELPQDNFPASGIIDYADLSNNSVRFDMASTKSPGNGLMNDPGDSILVNAAAVLPGSHLVANPRIYYSLRPNPMFDPYRTSGLPNTGWVAFDSTVAIGTWPTPERWYVDLPDEGFFFPGDIIHYYITAQDNQGGLTTFPRDTSGFSAFPGDLDYVPMLYPEEFTVRALPSLLSVTPGDQPPILLWNDSGGMGGQNEWIMALLNLGYVEGVDFDIYCTNAPTAGVGNGLGGRATVSQLSGYETILYTCGDLAAFTISNGDSEVEPGDDIGLLTAWLGQGGKNLLLTGDNLAFDLQQSGGATLSLLAGWISADFTSQIVRPMINDQCSPLVKASVGNPVFTQVDEWIAYGSSGNWFDAVVAAGNAIRLAEFTDPDGNTGAYSYAAATLHYVADNDATIIYLPYALKQIYTSPGAGGKAPIPSAARTRMLEDILAYFGNIGTGPTTEIPESDVFSVRNFPNPFNPSTKIAYHMPRRGELKVKIYNIRGELVATLIDEVIDKGDGFVIWDGNDSNGRKVSSGIYFYQAKTENKTIINKIALIK